MQTKIPQTKQEAFAQLDEMLRNHGDGSPDYFDGTIE